MIFVVGEKGKIKGRLIDAEILAKKVKSLRMILVGGPRSGKGFFAECMKQYLESVLRIIDEQPTVDAVPVVHGHWILTEEGVGWYSEEVAECSVCHEEFALGEMDFDDLVDYFKFCPNCGNPMDAERITNERIMADGDERQV